MSTTQFQAIHQWNDAIKTAIALVKEVVRLQTMIFMNSQVYVRYTESTICIVLTSAQQTFVFHFEMEDFSPDNVAETKKVMMVFDDTKHIVVPTVTVEAFGGVKDYLDMLMSVTGHRDEPSWITNKIVPSVV